MSADTEISEIIRVKQLKKLDSMEFQTSTQTSTLDRILAASLAAISMFVLGYTVTRVYLGQTSAQNPQAESTVIPHQASLWSDLGR